MVNQSTNPMTGREMMAGCQGEQILTVGFELADAAIESGHTKDDAATLRQQKALISLTFASLETLRNGDACAGCSALTNGEQAQTCFTLEPAKTAVELALKSSSTGEFVGSLNPVVRRLLGSKPIA